MFIVICAFFASKVTATSLQDIEQIEQLESNKAKLAAYKAVDQNTFVNQHAANEYFVAYAKYLSNIGEIKQAKQILEQKIASPTFEYDYKLIANLYHNLGEIHYKNDEYPPAKKLFETSISYYEKTDDIDSLTDAMMDLGSVELRTSNYLNGVQITRTYEKSYREQLKPKNYARIYAFFGRAYDHLGDLQIALEF